MFFFFFVLFVSALSGYSQTVENIRVVQDGENLKITLPDRCIHPMPSFTMFSFHVPWMVEAVLNPKQ